MDDTLKCVVCKEKKPKSDFYKSKSQWNGYETRCKKCSLERFRKLDKENPEWKKKIQLKSKLKAYGITLDFYEEESKKLEGKCPICGRIPKDRLHVDHCHKTNKFRGLICGDCNRGLGHFFDNPVSLEKAAEYLRSSGLGEETPPSLEPEYQI